jgi:hypothetical protein
MTATRSLGHLALHYGSGDEQGARRLLADLGFALVDNGPRPGEDGFCTVLLDGDTTNHADNIMFLARLSPVQEALERTIREQLGLGDPTEAPTATAFASSKRGSPEASSHIGIRFAELDAFERALLAVEADASDGGPLHGRVEIT